MKNLLWLLLAIAAAAAIGWLAIGRTPSGTGSPESILLTGAWLDTLPLGDGTRAGLELLADGTVLSINTATLTYAGWTLEGAKLTLREQSTGSGGTTEVPVVYEVKSLSADGEVLELIDAQGNLRTFQRETPEEKAGNQRFSPVVAD